MNPHQTTYAQILANVVKGHREMRGIAVGDWAKKLGMSRSTWFRLESGSTDMSVTQLRSAARVLKMPAWQLIREADAIAQQLEQRGVEVHDSKPNSGAALLAGSAALLALIAAASASSKE